MMKLALILGSFFTAVNAGSKLQNALSLVRQLNQTIGSDLPHPAPQRRLQTVTLPHPNCSAACRGAKCMYLDSVWLAQQVAAGGDAMVSAGGEAFGFACYHQDAVTCAAAQPYCSSIMGGSQAVQNAVALSQCLCTDCPNYPQMWKDTLRGLAALQSNVTMTAAQEMELACPMVGTFQCLQSSSSCAAVVSALAAGTLESALAMESTCQSSGYPTDYSSTYSFPSSCGSEMSGTVGLLQLNLLTGFGWLLSILN
mmetsp:Transcript_30063/g.36867  ORF Transcript_30063/g.36867 Transcript_30063/m.36867 type:complete len:254 (-) Transcript_30063:236-997(-)